MAGARVPLAPSLVEPLPGVTPQELEAVPTEGVIFSSPVADYRGRDDVVHLLGRPYRTLQTAIGAMIGLLFVTRHPERFCGGAAVDLHRPVVFGLS